jgi:hypothetical protein
MLIAYCGDLWEGSPAKMRLEALQRLGHTVVAVDTAVSPQRIAQPLGTRRSKGEMDHRHRRGEPSAVGTGLLSILLITAVISSSNAVLSTAAASSDRMWRVASCNGLWSVALIVAAVALVPRYRGLGLASAVLIAEIVSTSFLWVRFLSSTADAPRRLWGQQRALSLTHGGVSSAPGMENPNARS